MPHRRLVSTQAVRWQRHPCALLSRSLPQHQQPPSPSPSAQMASVLSVSTPALACSAAARRPAARSATARWAAPRAELAMRQSRPAALATQRAALAGDSSTHAIGARRIQRIQRQVVHAAPRAALDSVIAPLKAGPAPATYQATAIAAAVLALKLAWEARNGGGGLMLAAGYAVHAGAAYAIAAAGGKAGSETLKRMNAGLVRHHPQQILMALHFARARLLVGALSLTRARCAGAVGRRHAGAALRR
jgi:hypothetical protein